MKSGDWEPGGNFYKQWNDSSTSFKPPCRFTAWIFTFSMPYDVLNSFLGR